MYRNPALSYAMFHILPSLFPSLLLPFSSTKKTSLSWNRIHILSSHFLSSGGAGLTFLLPNRLPIPPNPPRSLLKNLPKVLRFSFSFAPASPLPLTPAPPLGSEMMSTIPIPWLLEPLGTIAADEGIGEGLVAPSLGGSVMFIVGVFEFETEEKRSMIAVLKLDGSNFIVPPKLAVLREAAAEFPSAERFCSAPVEVGAGPNAAPVLMDGADIKGVRRGDLSMRLSLYRGLSLCIWNSSRS